MQSLTPERAYIFRITHVANVPWILKNGIQCRSSPLIDPSFVDIGNKELIEKRTSRVVPLTPNGTLSDYVPFYFTPFSPMLYNIKTGYGNIRQRSNEDIVIFVTSLYKLIEVGKPFVYTDRHAYLLTATFSNNVGDIAMLPWEGLRGRDFSRDPERPDKMERYQAEALVYRNVETTALLGMATANDAIAARLTAMVGEAGCDLNVVSKPGWYFR